MLGADCAPLSHELLSAGQSSSANRSRSAIGTDVKKSKHLTEVLSNLTK